MRRRHLLENKYPPNGVYSYYSDGTFRTLDKTDSNAIGIAIITNQHKFVMALEGMWTTVGGDTIDLSGLGISYAVDSSENDFNGKYNTYRIVEAIGLDNSPACKYCLGQFDRRGYLPSIGQLRIIYNNKPAIKEYIQVIGSEYWLNQINANSSTLYDKYDNFFLNTRDGAGNVFSYKRWGNGFAFAVMDLEPNPVIVGTRELVFIGSSNTNDNWKETSQGQINGFSVTKTSGYSNGNIQHNFWFDVNCFNSGDELTIVSQNNQYIRTYGYSNDKAWYNSNRVDLSNATTAQLIYSRDKGPYFCVSIYGQSVSLLIYKNT